MTDRTQVYEQLKKLGISTKGWGAAEINELPAILMPGEEIKVLIRGWYENGFATLVATNNRLLLINKKLLHLTIEDIRYDMVAEVDFNARVTDASICVNTINKSLRFTSMRARRLRELTNYVQQRVMELRQAYTWQEYEQTPVRHDPLHAIQQSFMPQQQPATAAAPDVMSMTTPVGLPMVNPQLSRLSRPLSPNNFARFSLTTKHNFLPKVPSRFRPKE